MSVHPQRSPLAGKTVRTIHGEDYVVEDWWDRVAGSGWLFFAGTNPACALYAQHRIEVTRNGSIPEGLPNDDEVLYGKINGFGHLRHVKEIASGDATPT